MEIPKNVEILKVERAGALDGRGQAIVETIYDRRWARLHLRHVLVRGVNGDTVDIVGELWTDDMELLAEDQITVNNVPKDRYRVFDVRDQIEVDGVTAFALCRLVKQR